MIRAIVYGTKSKIIRRIIVCDTMPELLAGSHAGDGETLAIVNHDMPVNHRAARKHVAKLHGIHHSAIPSGRCAVVDDTGVVVSILMADPEIDQHPDGKLIAHEDAAVGDTLGAS